MEHEILEAGSSQAGSGFLRVLPDPNICRTKPIGEIKSFATCHVDAPFTCPHAMSYGNGYLCRHPTWKDFVKP